MLFILMIMQLWTTVPDSTAILQGNWQSCLGEERVYDRVERGKLKWSLHMGPGDDFALFKAGTEPDPDDHDDPTNLLSAHHADSLHSLTGRNWKIPSLGIKLNVVEAGGSRVECRSWFVRVERLK